jgi:serine phosphatase RsbU (regulator of sigma subunit)
MKPEQFSRERLIKHLTRLRDEQVNEIIDGVFLRLKTFLEETRNQDDCTMLAIRVLPRDRSSRATGR